MSADVTYLKDPITGTLFIATKELRTISRLVECDKDGKERPQTAPPPPDQKADGIEDRRLPPDSMPNVGPNSPI